MFLLTKTHVKTLTRHVGNFSHASPYNDQYIESNGTQENAWVLYTVIGACVLISLIALVVLYDLCSRYREYKDQQISDGGPPASPGHQFTYTFAIRVDEASPSFDTRQTVIRIELLDHSNQYLTSLAVPSFLFKFKDNVQKSKDRSPSIYPTPPIPGKTSDALQAYKSMTTLHENWANTPKANQVTFYLVRREPLKNFASVRLTHDCYIANAHISFKHIIIRDDLTQHSAKIDLSNKPIRAIHPCPPSGLQVFNAERLSGSQQQQIEETKSFIQLMKKSETAVFIICYIELMIFICAMNFERTVDAGSYRMTRSLTLGMIVGIIATIIMGTFFLVYTYNRRGSSNPFRLDKPPIYLLVGGLILSTVAFVCGVYKLTIYQKKNDFTLFFFITTLIALTTIMLALILTTIILANVKFTQELEPLNESPIEDVSQGKVSQHSVKSGLKT